jgi:hypothetical protein
MKRFFYFLAIVLIASCKKDDLDSISSSGFLEGFFYNNPKIIVRKTIESNIAYQGGVATYRGYIFKPLYDMRISAIGGRIAELGTFKIEIYQLHNTGIWGSRDTLLIDSVNINNINKFQFKNINHDLILLANEQYLIRYFNKNHNSVYDAGLGYSQPDQLNNIKYPLEINDIEIETPYYTYETSYNGKYHTTTEGTWSDGILRGLVDFKYELTK